MYGESPKRAGLLLSKLTGLQAGALQASAEGAKPVIGTAWTSTIPFENGPNARSCAFEIKFVLGGGAHPRPGLKHVNSTKDRRVTTACATILRARRT